MAYGLLWLLGYVVGAIPFGLLLSRVFGQGDIREQGSGNIGATNVYRQGGKVLGIATLLLDAAKGAVPLLLLRRFLDLEPAVVAGMAVALFLGHCFPVYLRFRGGKGVATALGIYLVLAPAAVVGALLVFMAVVWRWRYVSLGSISAAVAMPFFMAVGAPPWPLLLATIVIAALVIARHHANIARLWQGEEKRFKA